jgi:hypothetical protein
MKKNIIAISILFLALIFLVSCANPNQEITGMGETFAAYTMGAVLTQSGFETLQAQLTQLSQQATPSPSATIQATASITLPSQAPIYSSPVVSASTASGSFCDWAGFVRDVTIPDGTVLSPGATFTKTWRLENKGTCTWTRQYSLVYSGGNQLGASNTVPLSISIEPGQSVDVSIEMVAPSTPGSYISYWMLSNASGKVFGLGEQANGVLWVNIQVANPNQQSPGLALNMAQDYCGAVWTSGAGSLPCPGSVNLTTGSIYISYDVAMEGGSVSTLPALIAIPNDGSGGYVSGVFPLYQVATGDHLTTTMGCLNDFLNCDVIFEIKYRDESGTEHYLGSWGQTRDGYNLDVNIDLSSLAGTSVQIILNVTNNGSSTDDRAFWLFPAVWHASR